MNFSTTTEYALRIMSYMALDENKLYKASDIIEDLEIPHRYLRKLLTRLTKSEIIESIQGKYGGYRISKNLEDISLLDIVEASGEKIMKKDCFFGLKKCVFNHKCNMHDKWVEIQDHIYEVLSNTKLSDVKRSKPIFLLNNFDKV